MHVAAAPHPFRIARDVISLPAGLSLMDMLIQVQPDVRLRGYAHISVGGHAVPRENWHRVRPREGAEVVIRVVPQGGGDGQKSTLATVLSIVVLVAAAVVSANPEFLALGLTATEASLAGAAIGIAGTLAIQALVPPPSQDLDGLSGNDRSSPALSGTRNTQRPYGAIPLVLGRHRIFPPLAAPPYTEIVGNRQFLRALFVIGHGPLRLGQFKIGETPIETFKKYTLRTRQGFAGEDPIKLFPNTVKEAPLQVKLRQADGWRQRTSEPDSDQVSVDITFPVGLQRTNGSSGDRDPLEVDVEVEYRLKGDTGAWSTGSGGTSFAARLSAVMAEPAEVVIGRTGGGGATHMGQHQIFRVVMDPLSGDLETLEGEAVPAFHISGPELPADHEKGVENNPLEAPQWPDDKVRLAQVLRVTGEATVGAGRITDKRGGANALPVFTSFEFDSDFLPGPDSPVSTKIEIAAGKLFFGGFIVTGKRPTATRRSLLIDLPARGQYDLRLRRVTADRDKVQPDGDTNQDEVFWTALRSINNDPPIDTSRTPDLALAALRIQATDQLNGVIDSFNCVATSILPDWNGTDWSSVRATRNPASLFRAVLQGPGNARPLADSRLDLAGPENGLQAFHEYCTDEDWRFDMVRDFPSTVFETLRDVASAGRAAPAVTDGRWGVVIDQLKSVAVQHFTPRNSFGFQGAKGFGALPEGFRVRYSNAAKGWRQKELIVTRDGFDAATTTKLEGLDLPGITSVTNVKRHARLHLAQAELRPETWSFSTDVEALVCTRGDLIKITHDVILAGLAYGRIKAVTLDGGGDVTGLDLDEAAPMELGKSYAISIRSLGDAALSATVVTDPGSQTTISLSPVIPAANAPAAGDLFGFGEAGLETLEAIVKAIEPGPDLTFRLTCLPAAPLLHQADQGVIPAFDPEISEPIGVGRPAVEAIRSDESVLVRGSDGALASRILVTLFRPSGLPDRVTGIEAQIRPADTSEDWPGRLLLPRDAGEVSFLEVEDGEPYEFRLRYSFADSTFGDWTQTFTETVIGKSAPPPDVANLFFGNGRLLWDYPNPPPDLAGFRVKSHAGDNRAWASALDVNPAGLVSAPPFDISKFGGGTRSFMVKAVDSSGNESVDAAVVVLGLGDVLVDNVVLTTDHHPTFPGTITGGTVTGGVLEADGTGNHWLGDDANVLWRGENENPVWAPQFGRMVYQVSYAPPGPARLSLGMTLEALDGWSLEVAEALVAPLWEGEESNPIWSGVDAEPWWAATAGAFFAWPGELALLKREYLLRLTSFQGTRRARLSALSAVLDVPDVLEQMNDVALAAAGTRLPITKDFTAITGVRLTQQDDGGDAVRLVLKDRDALLGPLVQGEDTAGAGAAASVDALVQGYHFDTA